MNEQKKKSKLVIASSKGTLDMAYPVFILATTAAAQGMEVHLYFTFGGIKIITKGQTEQLKTSADLGIQTEELVGILSKKRMPSIQDMLKMAKASGVKIHACSPTLDLYGMGKEQLVDEVDDIIGAATFLEYASDPQAITLFI